MPFNTNLPAENTDPWYSGISAAWSALKTFVNGLESGLAATDTKATNAAAAAATADGKAVAAQSAAATADGKAVAAQAAAAASVQPAALTGLERKLTAGSNVTIDRTDPDSPIISASGGGGGGAVDSVSGRTGAVVLTKSDVGLANVDNTADAAKPVSTAQLTALNAKAPLASPAFTGTPTGITKAHVGLGSVDNTADSAKPVSSLQQTAINARVPKVETLASVPTVGDPDLRQVVIAGTPCAWENEWGARRYRNPYPDWADAGDRYVVGQGDNTNGHAVEIEDRRTGAPTDGKKVLWGRHWSDGHLTRNGLAMADSIILGASDPVPSNLPAGSIIVRPVA